MQEDIHTNGIHILYNPPCILTAVTSRLLWVVHVDQIGEMRHVCIISVERPFRNKPLGGPKQRPEDNIKMNLREMGCCKVEHDSQS
jgi:hypothetical protein